MPMRLFACLYALCLAAALAACTTKPPPPSAPPWEARLRGDALVLLGEVHDNGEQHRLRLRVLERAFVAGWRPAIVMEQFDRERQADLDRARRERPADARHLIDAAGGSGWDWRYYQPVIELAMRYEVPLIAGNLSAADTTAIVRGGDAAVFDVAARSRLGLDRLIATDWQQAQEREIDLGHCHALPPSLWPRMARAQFARDAVMAALLREHAGRGAVLLAGNGHVRRDLGVPRWLNRDLGAGRVVAVGFIEIGDSETPMAAFDAVVRTAAADRPDPCAGFAPR